MHEPVLSNRDLLAHSALARVLFSQRLTGNAIKSLEAGNTGRFSYGTESIVFAVKFRVVDSISK